MRVLVTGGAGFVGANLCAVLIERGHEVAVLDDLSTGLIGQLDGLDLEFHFGSVLSSDDLRRAGSGADAVVHLAGRPSVTRSIDDPRATHEANATGTLCVLEYARKTGKYVVMASSSSVYGSNPAEVKSESMACSPISPYAVSKLAAESYALAYGKSFGMPNLCLRFFNIYGPRQRSDHEHAALIPRLVNSALTDAPVTVLGDGEQSRDFTYIDTVAEVLAQAVERRVVHDQPVNLGFGRTTTINQVVDCLREVLATDVEVVHGESRPGDVRMSAADSTVLRSLFPTVRPVSLREGIGRTVEWMSSVLADERRAPEVAR
ncbi:NAD-dependent epimerase/dehydratase family protein [Saccharopolyspora sp. HNM0983]|uniref:NAD-dependent epimerase/dehydratase family protein n=1 Tax=Saccharopolyspora montiporae TaxID=2781240 RepID=A0A929BDR4_9PSEU|nr:NAD-dependent epimerase/dehydratase family protein [Saccharopolyspora sp. HNM0983]MBE9376495.1 NAD-dependent epimerase/dehydratase family protein [Saccharopolyspora sp. HNM0983]